MQYSSMNDSTGDDEFFRDESSGNEERAARKSRKSSSNPNSSTDDEARKRKKKKKKRPMTEEEIAARNARRSAKMEAEAAGLPVLSGAAEETVSSPREGEPRSSRRSTRSSDSRPREGTRPGAQSMSGSRGIDEAVKVGEFENDEEDPFAPRQSRQSRPADSRPRPSASTKKKQEINKDFKDVRETGSWGSMSKTEMWIVGIVCGLVLIGLIVGLSVGLTREEPAPPPPAPVTTPPPAPTAAPTARVILTPQQQLDAIRGATIDNPTTQNSLASLPEDVSFYEGKANDPTAAPVVRAASWIMYDDPIDNPDWLIPRYALAVLYYSTNGAAWTTTEGWMTDASACDWYGMRCDRFNKFIEEIDLTGNGLSGTMPDELNMIDSLISLWLGKNSISGAVPNVALGAIKKLSILYLNDNNLTGELTPDLAASGSMSKFVEI